MIYTPPSWHLQMLRKLVLLARFLNIQISQTTFELPFIWPCNIFPSHTLLLTFTQPYLLFISHFHEDHDFYCPQQPQFLMTFIANFCTYLNTSSNPFCLTLAPHSCLCIDWSLYKSFTYNLIFLLTYVCACSPIVYNHLGLAASLWQNTSCLYLLQNQIEGTYQVQDANENHVSKMTFLVLFTLCTLLTINSLNYKLIQVLTVSSQVLYESRTTFANIQAQ